MLLGSFGSIHCRPHEVSWENHGGRLFRDGNGPGCMLGTVLILSFDQIADGPGAPFNSRLHCWSATDGPVIFHEIVVREV